LQPWDILGRQQQQKAFSTQIIINTRAEKTHGSRWGKKNFFPPLPATTNRFCVFIFSPSFFDDDENM
jgi:hypothetical protein